MAHTDRSVVQSEKSQRLQPHEIDEVFELLGHPRRRHLLDVLAENGKLSVDELVADIADREQGAFYETAPEEATERIRLSLLHRHVPKLTAANVVEYDDEAEMLSLADTDAKQRFLARLQTITALQTMGPTADMEQ